MIGAYFFIGVIWASYCTSSILNKKGYKETGLTKLIVTFTIDLLFWPVSLLTAIHRGFDV